MSVEIPRTRLASVQLRPVLFSGDQESPLGGWTLPIPRLGDRFAVDITTAQLRQDADGRSLIAALTLATTGDALIRLIQPDRPSGYALGSPVVDGAGQAGSTLNLRGLLEASALLRGQYIGLVHSGRHYLHMVAAQAIAGADGRAAVPIWPMLRFLTTDGDVCEIERPAIEGQLVGFKGARFVRNRTEPLDFSIVERG